MKRSRQISLTLLASLSLTACDSEQAIETQRAMYQTKQACVDDWGSDDDCEDSGSGHWRGPHYYYQGGRPYYYPRSSGTTAMPVAESAGFSKVSAGSTSPRASMTTSSSVSRGGFGGSAATHGASS